MENINIYPDKKLKLKIKKSAEKEQRSMNNFILMVLRKYLKEKK